MNDFIYEKHKRIGNKINIYTVEAIGEIKVNDFSAFIKKCSEETKKEYMFDFFIYFKNEEKIKNVSELINLFLETKKHYYDKKEFQNNKIKLFFKESEKMNFFKEISFLKNNKNLEFILKKETWDNLEYNQKKYERNNNNYVKKEYSKDYSNKEYDYIEIEQIPVYEYELEKLNSANVKTKGEVFEISKRDIKNKTLFEIKITNGKSSLLYKEFIKKNINAVQYKVAEGDLIEVKGTLTYDNFSNDLVLQGDGLNILSKEEEKEKEKDNIQKERLETHLYTKYTTMDGITGVQKYFEYASKNNIKGLIFSDRENVQAYPDIFNESKKYKDIKVGYGVDVLVKTKEEAEIFTQGNHNVEEFVGIDLETTGFSQVHDEIIEVSAYKIENGVVKEFSKLINIKDKEKLTDEVQKITGITKEDLESGEDIKESLLELEKFIEGKILVAHNASFDIGFLKENYKKLFNKEKKFSYIDTLTFAKAVLSDEIKKFGLSVVAKKLDINMEKHHRALSDSKTAYYIFEKLMEKIKKKNIIPTEGDFFWTKLSFKGKKNLKLINEIIEQNEFKHNLVVDEVPKTLTGSLEFEASYSKYKEIEEKISNTTIKISETFVERKIENVKQLNEMFKLTSNNRDSFAVNIIAKNQQGIKDIFEIVSLSHTTQMENSIPLIDIEEIQKRRENLLIGTSFVDGVFKILFNQGEEVFDELCEKINYDFFEIAPQKYYLGISNSIFVEENVKKTLEIMIKKFENKMIVPSSGAFYTDKEDKIYREILVSTPAVGGVRHYLSGANEIGETKLLNYDEMKEAFAGLIDYEQIKENENKLFDLIDDNIEIIKNKLYTPSDDFLKEKLIPSVSAELTKMVNENVKRFKNQDGIIDPFVQARVDKELKSIIENNFATIYYIAYMLVKKSKDDGYTVGSRGSVGSSFVAYLMGITEVNPLRPHYRCANGDYIAIQKFPHELQNFKIPVGQEKIYENLSKVKSGYDLEEANCPVCGRPLIADGHDIPFETFLGFKGDKVPDIDLNFSGEYQSKAHEFCREIFGEDHAFRAGTISTIAEKTAFQITKAFYDKKNQTIRKPEIQRQAKYLEGVKRTTGQHPGGIIVIPKDMSIFDFTPYQYPANKEESSWKTTHFDFHSIHDNVLKLDILGHDDPTMLKNLFEDVKNNPSDYPFDSIEDIPLNDKKVISMLNLNENKTIKSLALPEFGTNFVREMLKDTNPQNFSELVKVSGLSHGTDVWLNNAKDLVSGNIGVKVPFSEVIGCRDDIMVYLINKGMDEALAFNIMEFVRKGKPNKEKDKWEEYKKEMKKHNIPDWYSWSCEQIKYMFPKAHATAYVMSALRIAWFKYYKPLQFYATYFSVKFDDFDLETVLKGKDAISSRIREITSNKEATNVEKASITTLEVAYEALDRGISFEKPSLKLSKSTRFLVNKENFSLIAPFATIKGLGTTVGDKIEEIQNKENIDFEEIKKYAKINKTVAQKMIELEIV